MAFRHPMRSFRPLLSSRSIPRTKQFTSCRTLRAAEGEGKQWQERDQIRPTSNEYSKTASDSDSAAVEDAAFSRDKTRPEEELESAGRESGSGENPLNVSPANPEVSKTKHATDGGAESSSKQSGKGPSDRESSSGPGSSNKAGKGKKYD